MSVIINGQMVIQDAALASKTVKSVKFFKNYTCQVCKKNIPVYTVFSKRLTDR